MPDLTSLDIEHPEAIRLIIAINDATSYWVPRHSSRTFVDKVDFVSGLGTDRGGLVKQVITSLGVFDFATPDGSMRIRSLHPGVTLDDVRENTGFAVAGDPDVTRDPTPDEADLIREFDPDGLRETEVR